MQYHTFFDEKIVLLLFEYAYIHKIMYMCNLMKEEIALTWLLKCIHLISL
jgi:hypothetical protein